MKQFYLLLFCSLRFVCALAQVQDSTAWIPNGYVSVSTHSGNTVYVAGGFSHVGPPTGGGGTLSLQDGRLVTPKFPRVEGAVLSCVPDGQGGWFIGGSFEKVGGVRVGNIAHILPENILDPNWKPTVNGPVNALLKVENTLYVGGDYTAVNDQPRGSLAALAATTGGLTPWNPDVKGKVYFPTETGEIRALAAANGFIYAGGNFTSVGGVRKSSLTRIRMDNGQTDAWRAGVDGGQAYALTVSGNLLYVGGTFTSLNSQPRNRIGAIDLVTETVTAWNPALECVSSSCSGNGGGNVSAIAVANNTVFIGGLFTQVGGQARNSFAAVDATTAQVLALNPAWNGERSNHVKALAVLNNTLYVGCSYDGLVLGGERLGAFDIPSGQVSSTWAPACFGGGASVRCLAVSAATNSIYAGGSFASVGGVKRWSMAAFDTGTRQVTAWNPHPGNTSRNVYALLADGDAVYIGGSFSSLGDAGVRNLAVVNATTGAVSDWRPNPDEAVYTLSKAGDQIIVGGNFTSIAGTPRNRLASVNAGTRQLTPWNPDANGSVTRSAASGDQVYIAGNFTQVGRAGRNKLASVLLSTGKVSGWNPNPNNSVSSLAVGGGKVYAGGLFTQIGGQSRNRLAAFSTSTCQLENWNPGADNNVIALAWSGKWLYAGGQFTTVGGQPRNLVAKIDATSGQVDSWSHPVDGGSYYYVNTLLASNESVYIGGWFDAYQRRLTAFPYLASLRTTSSVPNTIAGNVYLDANDNCRRDAGEESVERTIVVAEPGPYYGVADEKGDYRIAVDTGTYTVRALLPTGVLQPVCAPGDARRVRFQSYGNVAGNVDFANKTTALPHVEVHVASVRRRRCFASSTVVSYCNRGTAPAGNATLHVQLPEYVAFVSADKPYAKGAENTYVFELGTLLPNQCGNISITDSVVCNNPDIRGLTQCTKAWITPANAGSPAPGWDRSDVSLKARCLNNGRVRLAIYNVGAAPMADSSALRVYLDAQLAFTRRYKLNNGDSLLLQVPANGRTVRLEADQRPGHPNKRQSNVTLEACGVNSAGTVSTGFVTQFPVGAPVPGEATECQTIVDSYDPNDKRVQPQGTTASRYTPTGTALDYTIRFQNTGTDVAYTVVVVDTLSDHLDLATLRMGLVSHSYKLLVSGGQKPVLTFVFDNINLPDSNRNEALSHGYIKFSITPKSTIAPATVIENRADIFFDYNPAVRTNTVTNTIFDVPVVVAPGESDRVIVCSFNQPAFAGNDRSLCRQDTVRLQATAPLAGNGRWRVVKGNARIAEPLHPHSRVDALSYGDNVFEWRVPFGTCEADSSVGRVTIRLEGGPARPEVVKQGADSLYSTVPGDRYGWYLDGRPLTQTTRQIKATEDGQYQVQVFTADCASDLSPAYTYRNVTTGVAELSCPLIVYPNPAGKVVFIEFPTTAPARVHLVDAMGKTIRTTRFTETGQKQELHLNAVPAGVYLLRVEVGSRIILKKLMVR